MTMTSQTLHWLARISSGVILAFVAIFATMYFIGGEAQSSRPLGVNDYTAITLSAVILAGLAIGWKWELVGGAMALVGFLTFAMVNFRVFLFPGTLIPIAALLFLASWWTKRHPRPIDTTNF